MFAGKIIEVLDPKGVCGAPRDFWCEKGRYEAGCTFARDYGSHLREAREIYGYYNVRVWLHGDCPPMLIEGEGAVPHFEWV